MQTKTLKFNHQVYAITVNVFYKQVGFCYSYFISICCNHCTSCCIDVLHTGRTHVMLSLVQLIIMTSCIVLLPT